MPEAKFPPIAELLPHGSRAILLEHVISHDAATTVCAVDPAAGAHYRDADGALPACIGLEIMAQTIAAHGGLLDRAAGREARPGFFLGSRRLALAVPRFEAGQRLVATATHLRGSSGLLAFDCSIRVEGDVPAPLASGVLTVYLLESFEALTRDFATEN
ncbi:MAG: beta-hydroxyacyl-ACP dehydratase [Candidatus Binatia bacterium]